MPRLRTMNWPHTVLNAPFPTSAIYGQLIILKRGVYGQLIDCKRHLLWSINWPQKHRLRTIVVVIDGLSATIPSTVLFLLWLNMFTASSVLNTPPIRRVNTRATAEGARNGLSRCNKGLNRNGCAACPFITSSPSQVIKKVTLFITGRQIIIEGSINCKTTGGYLYLLWSSKAPSKQYLGSSTRQPRERLREHKGDINNKRMNKAVAKHFHDTGSTVSDLVFIPFKRIKCQDKLMLKHFENWAINEYDMISAGINRILA